MPLTPYSEQFLTYKQKLDKAISDLKLLVQEQISKEECLNLGEILERIREPASSGDRLDEQKGADDQIKQDKYFGVYLGIIQLEESKSSILECFIKWKNDHYYTMWEELSHPPQEMRIHWQRFKDKISKIILDCRKIGTRPFPRLVVSESKPTQDDSGVECTSRSSPGEEAGMADEGSRQDRGAREARSEGQEEPAGAADASLEGGESRRGRKRQQKEKGSSELWGPKTVPKSKNRYISGVSAVRAIRKRTYSSNGRVKAAREREVASEDAQDGDGEGKENQTGNYCEEQARNLRRWERVEERRNELKFNKYLLKSKTRERRGQESVKVEGEDVFRDPAKWSSNFSQGCRVSSQLEETTPDLPQRIRAEIDSVVHSVGDGAGDDADHVGGLENLRELCRQFLRENFGYEDFREGQLEAIYSVLLGGRSGGSECYRKGCVLILPTGYGKSLCFQYLSLLINKWCRKVTLVVTPLISLMQDQLRNLSRSIRGAVWNSSVSVEEKKFILGLIGRGSLDILFVTPESIFSTFLTRGLVAGGGGRARDEDVSTSMDLSNNRIGLLCVDEAHCVCEWGHSFRPSYYSCITRLVSGFRVERVLGITATAPSGMLEELKSLLRVARVIQPYSNQKIQRENLHCKVLHLDSMRRKAIEDFNRGGQKFTKVPKVYNSYSLIWDHVKYSLNSDNENGGTKNASIKNGTGIEESRGDDPRNGSGCQLQEKRRTRREVWSKCRNILIYVWQRSEVEAVTSYLRTKGANALYYHGMMSSSEREMVQKSFIENKTNIFVATTSFGMGIDKKDIDAVIHWNMPNSLEQYIQETGRCARQLDKLGICLMLLSDDDYRNKRQIISASLIDKTALRCLLHVILGNYRLGVGSGEAGGLERTRVVDLEIFPVELFKTVLNVRQAEEIETLLHYLKPYLDYLLGLKYKGSGFRASWVSYMRGSPYLKIRCFDEDFSRIKEKSELFGSLSRFSTENSGVVTVNLLEASTSLGRTLEELEDEIETERGVWRVSVERLTNKQCVIMGQSLVRGEDSRGLESGEGGFQVLRRDFGSLFLEARSSRRDVDSDDAVVELRENWVDLLVEDLHRELVNRNSEELWKLDVAYFSFQKFGMDRSCKDSIMEAYFGNRRSELYSRLFSQEVDAVVGDSSVSRLGSGQTQSALSPGESLEGVSRRFVKELVLGRTDSGQDRPQTHAEVTAESSGDSIFEKMVQEIWIARWSKELGQLDSFVACPDWSQDGIVCRSGLEASSEGPEEQGRTAAGLGRDAVYQKISSCIRLGVNCLLSTYLSRQSPVQWETYRISTERVASHFVHMAQKESKKRRVEDGDVGHQRLDFGHYLSFEEFDVVFPGDIARILVGVTSFRYSYRSKGGLRRDRLDGSEVVSSRLWGKFKNIPYSVVLGICQESFREAARGKLSLKTGGEPQEQQTSPG